jgi:hypothetical protein
MAQNIKAAESSTEEELIDLGRGDVGSILFLKKCTWTDCCRLNVMNVIFKNQSYQRRNLPVEELLQVTLLQSWSKYQPKAGGSKYSKSQVIDMWEVLGWKMQGMLLLFPGVAAGGTIPSERSRCVTL